MFFGVVDDVLQTLVRVTSRRAAELPLTVPSRSDRSPTNGVSSGATEATQAR